MAALEGRSGAYPNEALAFIGSFTITAKVTGMVGDLVTVQVHAENDTTMESGTRAALGWVPKGWVNNIWEWGTTPGLLGMGDTWHQDYDFSMTYELPAQ